MFRAMRWAALPVMLLVAPPLLAGEATDPQARPSGAGDVREAVTRGLPIVQKAAANYPKNRQCFSCHHQTLPMLAMVKAKEHGVDIDEKLLLAQAEFSAKSFQERSKEMKEGRGIGGRGMTVGYGLWALDLAGSKPNDTTEAMVTFLLKSQKDDGSWVKQTSRPPLEDSNIMCTILVGYYLPRYATEAQREQVEAAVTKAKTWLAKEPVKHQEDKVARLWGLYLLNGDKADIRAAREAVLKDQREDGGWAQLAEMKSDAYATGQALFVLQATGLPTDDPAYQRGVQFLLKTQEKDGSWFVETRSRPVQIYFDNGDPHGKNQFISIPATSWAVAALAASLEKTK